MTTVYYHNPGEEEYSVELRDPRLAAVLAWLWPGAGHFYQRRWVKGFIFMICIMGTFIYGMLIGQGRVAYASFRQNDLRWQFIPQSGIGAPALLAVAQKLKTSRGDDPFFVLCERYPEGYRDSSLKLREYEVIEPELRGKIEDSIKDGFMAPPGGPVYPEENDVLGMWHASLKHRYDVGTIFTLLAGLLNFLAIYDAFAGPAAGHLRKKKSKSDQENGPASDSVDEPVKDKAKPAAKKKSRKRNRK